MKKHSMKKIAAVLAAAAMLCGTAGLLPDSGIFRPANTITASAYSYNQYITKNINTDSRIFNWPFADLYSNNTTSISSSFHERVADRNYKPHGAVDIGASMNTPVRPVYTGTVIAADQDNYTGRGRHIIIQHTIKGKTYYSQYSHLQTMNVKVNDTVYNYTTIGTVGGSGGNGYGGTQDNVYPAHLDLQISLYNPKNLTTAEQWEALTIDPLKVMKLPNSLRISADNYDEVGNYIYDNMNHDRCPSQLKNTENIQSERVLTCRLSHHKIGRRDGDAWAASVGIGAGWMVYGPYEKYSAGNKRVKFRLKTNCTADAYYNRYNRFDDSPICTIDVYDSTSQRQLNRMEIHRSDFLTPGEYQDFCMDFRNISSDHKLEFRIYYHANADVWADRVFLYKR